MTTNSSGLGVLSGAAFAKGLSAWTSLVVTLSGCLSQAGGEDLNTCRGTVPQLLMDTRTNSLKKHPGSTSNLMSYIYIPSRHLCWRWLGFALHTKEVSRAVDFIHGCGTSMQSLPLTLT